MRFAMVMDKLSGLGHLVVVPKIGAGTSDEAATMETISPNYATARVQTSGIQGSVGLRFTELMQSSEIPPAGGRQVISSCFPNYWET